VPLPQLGDRTVDGVRAVTFLAQPAGQLDHGARPVREQAKGGAGCLAGLVLRQELFQRGVVQLQPGVESSFQRQIGRQAERELTVDRDVDSVGIVALGGNSSDLHSGQWTVDSGQ
jgi:hypothetical protein